MEYQYFIDTARLADHVEKINEKKQIIRKIRDEIEFIKAVISADYVYDVNLINTIRHLCLGLEDLIHYYSSLTEAMENCNFDAEITVKQIGKMLSENQTLTNFMIHDILHTD